MAERASRKANELVEQQVEIQCRLVQIEQSREQARVLQSQQAVIRAELCKLGTGNWRLVVRNSGQSTACNVTLALDGQPFTEHKATVRGEQEIREIGPESEISYCIVISNECKPPFDLEVTWDDDSGRKGQYRTTLSF